MTGPADTATPRAGFFYVLEEPLKLLFVDDDPILREFALVHLASEQGEVAVAEDGEAALKAITSNLPDLVLLDLQMPKVDGFAVLKALRADEATKRLPVIVITGRDDVVAIDRAFSEGATSFLVKPINWRLLTYQIRFVARAHRNEISLTAASRAAAVASDAKARFLAAMSHELRTPLNAVIGFSQIISGQALGPLGHPRYLEYARDIQDSGTHLLSLINDVLELSRAESGETTLHEEEFAVGEVIDEVAHMVMPQVKAAALTLSINCDAQLPRVMGDRTRIRQVLINLISNAAKFTPEGGQIFVTAQRTGSGLTITVRDTGIGIADEDIPKALDRFSQVDGALARKFEGAGLGLPLSKEFVEMHDGELAIESKVGAGTTVTVTLPASRLIAERLISQG